MPRRYKMAENGVVGGNQQVISPQQVNDVHNLNRSGIRRLLHTHVTTRKCLRSSRVSSSSASDDSLHRMDELHVVETSHSIQVLTGLNSLRTEGLFCDVTLCVDDDQLPCHKIVLASFSPYFKAMFSGEMVESQLDRVVLNGVEAAMIRLLVEYGYTAEITITKSNVQSLLSAANLLEILPVRDACCHFMEKQMDESNCLGIHCFAEAHACVELQEIAKSYSSRFFMEVVCQEEFLLLSSSKLIELISSDDLHVEHEEDVLEAVFKWYLHSPEERADGFEMVLTEVRLPLISPYFLHDCYEKYEFIRQSSACRSLFEEAKTYHLIPDRRAELRSSRTRARNSTGIAEMIVAVGGEDDKVVLRSVECFDPHSLNWIALACLPFAISKHGLVISGNNVIYMAGGEFPDGAASRSLWKYDPIYDLWQELAPMLMPRSELGLAMLDGCIYAVGGWEGSYRLACVEKYTIKTNTWEPAEPMKMGLTSPAVAAYNGSLYVTGGAVLEDGDGINLVQQYNPRSDSWTDLAPMNIARSGSAACILNNVIYIIGGWHASTENTSKVECYDPKKNQWTLKASMNERRYRPGVAVVDGKIYVCGGEEGWDRYHDTIECFDEKSDQWTIVGEMPSSRSWLSCVTLLMSKARKVQDET